MNNDEIDTLLAKIEHHENMVFFCTKEVSRCNSRLESNPKYYKERALDFKRTAQEHKTKIAELREQLYKLKKTLR